MSTRKPVVAFGHWPSPIAAKDVAGGARRFGMVAADGPWIYWTEGRPEEKGRQVIMRVRPGSRKAPMDVLAAPYSARSRVHEYGGGELLVSDGRLFFVNDADQDIYEVAPDGGEPKRLTQEPTLRVADMCLDAHRSRLIAVAERHGKQHAEIENLIVSISLEGAGTGRVKELCAGRDFYAAPRLAPDGEHLAYIAWDLPGMPWDEAELLVADIDADGLPQRQQCIAGGSGVAASHPLWAPDGRLIYVTDATGFGSLMSFDGVTSHALTRQKREFGRPPWVFGAYPFAIDQHGVVWAAPVASSTDTRGESKVLVLPPTGSGTWHAIGDSGLDSLAAYDGGIAAIAANASSPSAVTSYAAGNGLAANRHRLASKGKLAAEDISVPQMVHFRGGDGQRSFAFYYPPANSRVAQSTDEVPPAIVMAHGGPTASADRGLKLRTQFYTSRGFAVLDVDYAGSTGYGRAYRERLDGRWGTADVADCAAGARFLVRKGLADPKRIAIAGGSAGGYTVLMALATTDVFAAGSSHYGISDLSLLMEHTHKFESGYLHRLLGTTAKAWNKTCRERSPIRHISSMAAPVILFQGLEDKVVPPEQSRLIHEGLKERGIDTELHEFPGEGHGFRRAETIIAVLEAELEFLVRTLRLG